MSTSIMDISFKDLSANDFYKWFNDQFKHIEDQIDNLKTDQEKSSCLEQISTLTLTCRNVKHHLSQHDQKLYSDQLQKLQERTEGLLKENKPKFSFRRKKEGAKEKVVSGITSSVTPSPTPSTSTPSNYHISDQLSQLITETDSVSSTLQLSNITNSIIYLNNSFNSAKLDNITASVIFLPSIKGPIYASTVTNSIIIANCHQFRIHKSINLNLYLSCRSKRPIIENCSNLGFGQYPLSLTNNPNEIVNWITIDDFNWIRKTQSINWFELTESPSFQWLLDLPLEFDSVRVTLENSMKSIKTQECIDK